MPAVGDQHKSYGNAGANPFEEPPQRLTEYTAQEIATLQSRLDKQLGPEYVSARVGPGGQSVHYLAADKAISLANEVFGFNGWSSSIQNIQIDFVDENPQTGRVSLGLSVIVRITLKDGAHHEDIGYGQIENCKGKAAAFEKAKKEGTTDALKRALRNFGNVLGNCIYDKNYLQKVTKVKVGAPKWDPDMLHRHADFVPKKQDDIPKVNVPNAVQEPFAEFDDTFDPADFEEADFDHPDLDHLDEAALRRESAESRAGPARQAPERAQPTPNAELATASKPTTAAIPAARPGVAPANIVPQPLPGQRPTPLTGTGVNPTNGVDGRATHDDLNRPSPPSTSSPNLVHPLPGQHGGAPGVAVPRSAAFYSAKVARNVDENNNTSAMGAAAKFNPHAESPSIRKTSGVNHNSSVPLKRDLTPDTTRVSANLVNPQADASRRVGAPGSNAPFTNARGPGTSAYRPPTRRGPEHMAGTASNGAESIPADRPLPGVKRMPLGDVSNFQSNTALTTTGEGAEPKRQRFTEPGQERAEVTAATSNEQR